MPRHADAQAGMTEGRGGRLVGAVYSASSQDASRVGEALALPFFFQWLMPKTVEIDSPTSHPDSMPA